jgi:hypothetical protein
LVFNDCISHILLVVAALLTWVVAALSATFYLIGHRWGSSSNVSCSDSRHVASPYSLDRRIKLTMIYVGSGLVLFTGGMAMGYLNSKVYWKGSPLSDLKVIFSLGIWAYYAAILGINMILRLKKRQQRGRFVSILTLVGLGLLMINILLGKVSGLHHYL